MALSQRDKKKKAAKFLKANIWWNGMWAWDAVGARYALLGSKVTQTQALTFTRNSSAYQNTGTNVWASVSSNVIRQGSQGARLEKAATNMALYSGDLTNAAWRLLGTATSEATAIPAPAYGNFTRFYRNSETANALLCDQQITTGVTVGEWYCAWCYVMGEGANIGKLAALEIKRYAGGSYAGNTVTVRLTDKPQLVSVFFQTITGNTAISPVLHVGNTDLFTSVLVSNMQVEVGKSPTSPIQTTTAQVTRAADALPLLLPQNAQVEVKFADNPRAVLQRTVQYRDKVCQTFVAQSGAEWPINHLYWNSDVQRFTVKNGDVCIEDTAEKERSEMMTGSRFAKSVDVWNSHAFKVDSNFTTSTNPQAWFIIGQWHGDASDDRSPYFSIKMVGNDLVIDKRIYNGSGGQSAVVELYRWINFPRDVYHNIVMTHKVDATVGYAKVWINGVQVVDTGLIPFGYWDHTNGGYWKWGIYRNAGNGGTAIVEYQNWEEDTVSLFPRVGAPLALNLGKQTLNATLSGGSYSLPVDSLNHPVVQTIYAVAP
jgi:hypothetical protein